jgi:hypothetical protein
VVAKNTEVILIYGLNGPDPGFFIDLENILTRYRDLPVIIGGDWNATLSRDLVHNNIDVSNMVRLPNIGHSNKIAELIDSHNQSDPFRLLYPDKKEFLYVPRHNLSQNRSRLDFF